MQARYYCIRALQWLGKLVPDIIYTLFCSMDEANDDSRTLSKRRILPLEMLSVQSFGIQKVEILGSQAHCPLFLLRVSQLASSQCRQVVVVTGLHVLYRPFWALCPACMELYKYHRFCMWGLGFQALKDRPKGLRWS